MNKEQQLEQIVESVRSFEVPKAPPVFELYASLVAISISILLLLLPGVFEQNDSTFYVLMRTVLPQIGWAALFFVGGVMAALGMLFDGKAVRIISLLLLTVSFGVVASFYIVTFPNLSGLLMSWLTIFTAASIPMVKYTGIRSWNKK